MVLLTHQLAGGIAGEDQHGVPRRFTLFQQRLPPFGARGAADFQRQRVVAVLGAVLCGFPRGQAAQHVIFKGGDQRRIPAARQRMADHLRHLAQRVVAVLRQAARVIPLSRQAACGVILKPPAFAVRVHQRRQTAKTVVAQARQMARRVGGAHHLPARVARHLTFAQPVIVLPAEQPGVIIFVVRLAAIRPPPGAQTPRRGQRPAVGVAFGVAGAERSPRVVVKPLALVAGAVLVAHQLPALVPPEPVRVVQRVGLLNQVALLVPLKARHAAFRVSKRHHIAARIVFILPGGAVRQHFLHREREHRVPRGERAVAERIAHFRQVAVLVVAIHPAAAIRRGGRFQQLGIICPLVAPHAAVAVGVFRDAVEEIPAVARRETRVAAYRGAAFRLVGVDAPAFQHIVLIVQHLITAHAPVGRIGGGLPLIMHAEVGGVAVPAHHVAGAIPAEAARDDAVRVGDLDQLAVFVIAVSHQQAALAVAYLMHAGEAAMRFLVGKFDIQRFVVAGNARQPAVFIPAVILAVLVTIVDAEQAPLARTRRVRFVDVVFAARHLEHQRAADGVIERDAVFEIIHHVAGGQLAEAQLAARHIAPDKLVVFKAEEAGLKRQQPAGAEHTGRQIAAVVDTLPDERNAVFQREIAIFAAREDFRAAGDIHRVLRVARLAADASSLKQGNRRHSHGEIRKKLAAEHLAHTTVEYRL
ncbi:hypothetical protein BN132_2654 [Cronobacter turicensis 564]|nr:hypothetical protein BN132_2654 [Cronobacter turicensis 564]